MFLIQLIFFSFRSVGSHAFHNLSQTMISRYVAYYSFIISENLASNYIRFPYNLNEMEETKAQFEASYHFPGILGVIDGTHVALTALPLDIENAYVNRKGFHSINTQIVCDANMLITNINARFPGSTHDAFIFGGSVLNTRLEEHYHNDPATFNFLLGKYWNKIQMDFKNLFIKITLLLGDSAYPLSPWLLKIFDGNNLSEAQENFNRELCSIRQIIERCIGLLKVRFRCILGERKLRYSPTKVGRIIYSCATLHNFLIFNRYDIRRDIDDDMLANVINAQNIQHPLNQPQVNLRSGQVRRNEVMNYLIDF